PGDGGVDGVDRGLGQRLDLLVVACLQRLQRLDAHLEALLLLGRERLAGLLAALQVLDRRGDLVQLGRRHLPGLDDLLVGGVDRQQVLTVDEADVRERLRERRRGEGGGEYDQRAGESRHAAKYGLPAGPHGSSSAQPGRTAHRGHGIGRGRARRPALGLADDPRPPRLDEGGASLTCVVRVYTLTAYRGARRRTT